MSSSLLRHRPAPLTWPATRLVARLAEVLSFRIYLLLTSCYLHPHLRAASWSSGQSAPITALTDPSSAASPLSCSTPHR